MSTPTKTRVPPNLRGRAGKGRPKGAVNKTTRAAREAFMMAAEGIGGVAALTDWAKRNPTEFWKLYARLIPAEHHIGVGEGAEPYEIRVRFVDPPERE